MNREILFRGKRTDNCEWAEGYYAPSYLFEENGEVKNTYCIISDKVIGIPEMIGCGVSSGLPQQIPVLPETVGQYTGLDDKNGKKIFDGDIVKDEYNRVIQVYYHDNLHRLLFKLISFESAWSNNFLYADFDSWFLSIEKPTIEIIGNIHDNPELLEEKK